MLHVDVHIMEVLFRFDGLTRWFSENSSKFDCGRLPLSAGESLGANDQLPLRRDGNDQFSHFWFLLSTQKRTRIVTLPSAPAVRCTLPRYRRRACSAS